MRNFPRWRGLKHFNNVATLEFTDANQFRDVLKASTHLLLELFVWLIRISVHRLLHMPSPRQERSAGSLPSCLPAVPRNGWASGHDRRALGPSSTDHRQVPELLRGVSPLYRANAALNILCS
jgi:hypothetical protein